MKEETAAAPKFSVCGRIVGIQGGSVKTDPSRIGPHDIRQAFEEHGFSGSAGADDRADAAAAHGEFDPRQNHMVAEALVKALHLKQQILFGGAHDQSRNDVMT